MFPSRRSAPDSPDLAEPPESALVRAAMAGDRAAFARLYERFGTLVHAVLIAMVPRDEAADLTQDVFLTALRMLPTLEQPDRFTAWLCTIARNRARDAYKSKHKRRPERSLEFDEPGLASESLVAESSSADEEQAERVLAVLQSLPEAYRETLSLRLIEGLKGPEIAHLTGMTAGSVRVNLFRGMQLLRARLQQHGLAGELP